MNAAVNPASNAAPGAAMPAAAAGGLLAQRWRALAARERAAVVVAALALALLATWLLALQPALRTLKEAPAELAALDAQLQTMQRLAAEARELRATPPLPAGQSAEALRVATQVLGDKARITLQGERATVVLTGVSPTALRDWLGAARTAARARPLEASLTHAPAAAGGGSWSGNVVLQLGGGS